MEGQTDVGREGACSVGLERGPGAAHKASRRAVAHGILTASPGADAAIPPLYRRVSEAGAGADAQPPGWIPAGLTSRGASGPSEPLLLR